MMEPEYFQYLLLMLITIGKSRPHNLLLINDLVDGQLADEVLNRQEIGPKLESYDIKVHLLLRDYWGGGGEEP